MVQTVVFKGKRFGNRIRELQNDIKEGNYYLQLQSFSRISEVLQQQHLDISKTITKISRYINTTDMSMDFSSIQRIIRKHDCNRYITLSLCGMERHYHNLKSMKLFHKRLPGRRNELDVIRDQQNKSVEGGITQDPPHPFVRFDRKI